MAVAAGVLAVGAATAVETGAAGGIAGAAAAATGIFI